jgi:FixJ family two-component response regulator
MKKSGEKDKRVLVVDDEASVCKSVSRILEREDLKVDEALSGKDALSMLEKKEYGVVITDMMMPGIGGLDLIRMVKERWPEISIIMITGYATIKTAVQAIKLGAFDYIPKPFTPEELVSVTNRAFQRMVLHGKEFAEEEQAPSAALKKERDRYYILEHSWAVVEDGTVKIGMDDMFQKTAGNIVNIDLPFEGDIVEQGKVCVRVTSTGMKIHKLWSPVTGKVVEVNSMIQKDPSVANRDPYGKGWLVRVIPFNLDEEVNDLVLIKKE